MGFNFFDEFDNCTPNEKKLSNFTRVKDWYTPSSNFVPSIIHELKNTQISRLEFDTGNKIIIDSLIYEETEYPILSEKFYPQIDSHIGEGLNANVYSMNTSNKSVAVKIQKHSTGKIGWDQWLAGYSMDIPMNPFAQEVYLHLYASSGNLAPIVFNSWHANYKTTCHTGLHDIIVMEKMDMTLGDYVLENINFTKGVVDVIKNLHIIGIFHGDLTSENIMINSKNEPIIIDFSRSKPMPISPNGSKWCMIHDFMTLYKSLHENSLLREVIKGEARKLSYNFTILGKTFDFN